MYVYIFHEKSASFVGENICRDSYSDNFSEKHNLS